jgi:VWFA-related protein
MVVAAVAAAVSSVHAQTPTFKTRTELVQLDVVVTDKDDRPVRGLTREDFEIVERGRLQQILTFDPFEFPSVRRSVGSVSTAAPTKDVVTNVHPSIARQWALVIDDLHIMATHIVHTKRVVQDFLEQIPETDAVAIVFVGRSDLSQDFTSDLGAQMRAVNRIKDALGFAPDLNGFIAPRVLSPPGARRQEMSSTFIVMRNIANVLAKSSYPRKAFVWVSEGSSFDLPPYGADQLIERDVFDEQLQVFKVLQQAGVPVYTLDPRGPVDCSSMWGPCGGDPSVSHNYKNQASQLRTFAENTGGRAFVGASDMPRAIRELVEDNNAFYLLGYSPDPLVADGKFHDVDVRVRRAGLKVRARSGYTARRDVTATMAEAKATLNDVLSSALPVPALTLSAVAAPVKPGGKGMRTAVTLEVTYPQLAPGPVDDQLEFGIVAVDHDGKIKSETRGTYTYSATVKPGQDVKYLVNAEIDLPAQPLSLRIGVSSRLLDRAASIFVPVEAINPRKDTLQIASVLIGYTGRIRETAVPPGGLRGFKVVQPTTDRTFVATDVLGVSVPVYWRRVEGISLQTDAVVDFSIVRDGQVVRASRMALPAEPTPLVPRSVHGILTAVVPLQGLSAGDYLLRVDAHLAGGSAARREIAFTVKR